MRRIACRALAALLALCAVAALVAALPGGAAAASCQGGPVRVGDTIEGTPCADRIVVPPGVASVDGGAGDDTIVPAPIPATVESCPAACHLGVGSQTFEGGPGDDVVFGERGNDRLYGGEGNDRLYGGIGDDLLEGGTGNDLLAGGFGADSIDGQAGDDYVRGDGTIDRILDTGGGFDTLSYSTGVTPGFGAGVATGATGFPGGAEGERGVHLDLSAGGQNGDDGIAALGGGVDEVEAGAFERIVGTPFSDFIVGSGAGETIVGGGGADVIRGGGGEDTILGGADGDDLDGGEGADVVDGEAGQDNCRSAATTSCEGEADAVALRDSTKVEVGEVEAVPGLAQVYLVGSTGADAVVAGYSAGAVTFSLTGTTFDQGAAAAAGCTVAATFASCPLAAPLDSLLLAGLAGNDQIAAEGLPDTTGVVLAGGSGADALSGGAASEDVLVDGPGAAADEESAFGGDDALLHNGGADTLRGGEGNDLFLSVSVCDGESIEGEGGRDNSSWARLDGAVAARLDEGRAGVPSGESAACGGGAFDALSSIEDLEGSNGADVLYGDAGPNQLLGHLGADVYRAGAGEDSILANSADTDAAIDCGADADVALIDVPNPPAYEDPPPVECEAIRTGAPNNFETVTELPPPPPPPAEPPPQPRDVRPPQTRIVHHPPRLILARRVPRRVAFRFAASEPGSRFRCAVDRRPTRGCASPRAYRVGAGSHVFRVVAVDRAGNADPSPAVFRFRLRRR